MGEGYRDDLQRGSADRSRRLAEARTLSAYFAVETGVATLTKMGEKMNRDVATLNNAIRRIREGCSTRKI